MNSKAIAAAISLLAAASTVAQNSEISIIRQNYLPERAIVIHGSPEKADSSVIGIFYSREGLDFSDANAPRFLLLDRQGKIAFGIGGSLYATASYDFDGAIDGNGFTTYDIPVPLDPSQRQRFGADASNSSLFLKLVGKSDRLGIFNVYMQAKFTGDNGKYGFKLKQAYVSILNFTAGLTTSTFVDAATQAPTIDTQGDCGQISDKSMLFRYTTPSYKGLSGALSIEIPSASYTLGTDVNGAYTSKKIAQRVPDIPLYIQYAWKGGHVRASAIIRNLSYRNLVDPADGKNHFATCWGTKLSAIGEIGILKPFGHISYGKGISAFVNDLSGEGFDLVPGDEPGELTPAASMTWTVGTYVNFSPKLFATASWSRAQVFDCGHMGADTYRYGMYAAANIFYDFDDNFRLGAEYLHGWRDNYSGTTGHANRLNLLMQYSF